MGSLGAQIDKMYQLEREIDRSEKVVKGLKQQRAQLEDKLLHDFEKEDIDGCRGKLGIAGIRTAEFPSIKDRQKFDKYVLKHRALDLFQNRLSSKAWKARVEEGEKVPGIAVFERIRISIRKRGRK
jgi:hypothetical protein